MAGHIAPLASTWGTVDFKLDPDDPLLFTWGTQAAKNQGVLAVRFTKFLGEETTTVGADATTQRHILYMRRPGNGTTAWLPIITHQNSSSIGSVRVTLHLNNTYVGSTGPFMAGANTTVYNRVDPFTVGMTGFTEKTVYVGTITMTVQNGDSNSKLIFKQLWGKEY